MTFIIEFAGRPGAGKTRACRDLLDTTLSSYPEKRVKKLLSDDSPVCGPLVKCCVLLYCFGFHHARVDDILLRFTEALSSHSRLRLISSLVNAVYLDYRLRQAVRCYDIVLLDQGFLQLCWTNLSKGNEDKIKATVSTLYAPYAEHEFVLVRVEPSSEVFDNGLRGRKDLIENGGYRFAHLDDL